MVLYSRVMEVNCPAKYSKLSVHKVRGGRNIVSNVSTCMYFGTTVISHHSQDCKASEGFIIMKPLSAKSKFQKPRLASQK
jgi:hypothetical protein